MVDGQLVLDMAISDTVRIGVAILTIMVMAIVLVMVMVITTVTTTDTGMVTTMDIMEEIQIRITTILTMLPVIIMVHAVPSAAIVRVTAHNVKANLLPSALNTKKQFQKVVQAQTEMLKGLKN